VIAKAAMNYILGSSFYNARMASTQPRNSTSTVQLPASLLEVFVPGYSTMSGLLFEAFGFDMTLIVSLAFLVYALVRSIDFLRDQTLLFITRFGTCSVSMDSDSDSYFWMVGWLADHGVGEASYSLMALPKSHAKSWQVMPDNSIEIHTGNVPRAPPSASGKVGDSVRYEPSLGLSQYFWHKNRLFLWHRQRQKKAPETGYDLLEGTSSRIEARIYCLSRSTSPIKALIEESAEHYRRKSAARTSIRRPAPSKKRREGMYPWIKVASRPSRAMDTVVLDQTEKERVIADIEAYLEPSARFWYASRGIPYRRGYVSFTFLSFVSSLPYGRCKNFTKHH
jgi:chaperone BCS1